VLVNLLVALVFGYGMPNFCNFLITVFKTRFLFCISCNVLAGVTGALLAEQAE